MSLQNASRVDPITFEVVNNALIAVCGHMAESLRRTSYSPIIHDAADFSCALLDADANLISENIGCPIHLGTLPLSVRTAVEEYGPERLRPGDILGVNDPYRGGVHLTTWRSSRRTSSTVDCSAMSPTARTGRTSAATSPRAWPAAAPPS